MRVRWGTAIAALLLIVAVAACGDDGGGASTPTTDAPEELTTDEWIAAADEICTEGNAADEFDQPAGDPRTVNLTDRQLDAWADYFEAILPIGHDAVEQFRALLPPEEIATDADELNELRDESVALIEEAVDAARSGDNVAFRSAVVESLEIGDQIDELFIGIGTEVCGQDGSTGETLPPEQWTDEVVAICTAQSEVLLAIPEPSVPQEEVTEANLPEVATFLAGYRDAYLDTVDQIAAVGTPEGAESDASAFLDAMDGIATAFDESFQLADAGDLEGWNGSTDAIGEAFSDAGSIGQDLGVEACAQ